MKLFYLENKKNILHDLPPQGRLRGWRELKCCAHLPEANPRRDPIKTKQHLVARQRVTVVFGVAAFRGGVGDRDSARSMV